MERQDIHRKGAYLYIFLQLMQSERKFDQMFLSTWAESSLAKWTESMCIVQSSWLSLGTIKDLKSMSFRVAAVCLHSHMWPFRLKVVIIWCNCAVRKYYCTPLAQWLKLYPSDNKFAIDTCLFPQGLKTSLPCLKPEVNICVLCIIISSA